MNIADHIAIFLHGSLDQARPSKAKPGKIEFYGRFALPPTAFDSLMESIKAVAPNGNISGLQLAPKLHSSLAPDKQFAGIPRDWFIVRMSSGADYPPDLFAVDGSKIAAIPLNGGQIRTEFYSGQRVRINTYAFFYPPTNGGSAGVSFNLSGIMAVGGGERIGNGGSGGEPSESAFAKYRNEPAQVQQAEPVDESQGKAGPGSNGGATGNNPFQQGTSTTQANPFG